ncbi:MAG TPA: MFS transporter [Stellaceae bacterium]|jgi:putative MFS transporter|nr:MFS transporter [Stellaceae bacterium]
MLERLEQQQKLTANQWKIAGAATLGDMLDFFDFYLIGFVLAFVVKEWHLTYGQSGAILLASGVSAPFGSLLYGWLADKVGRRKALIASVLNVSFATGAMALTPEGGWIYLVACRFLVGFGVTGLYSVDITLMQEFSPAHKRGWFTGLTTTMLPAGSLLAALLGAFAAQYIGWRGMVAIGLVPAALCLYIRAFVPESPHWLLRQGRLEEARKALAWALQIDPAQIELPTILPAVTKTRWLDIFNYPRSIIVGCLTGLTQTGSVGLALWQVTLFVMVLHITPAEASKLVIWISLAAIFGRFFCSWISDAWGRRASGIFSCVCAAVLMSLAGYLHDYMIGSVSVFVLLIVAQSFFGSGQYSIVGPYMGEMWPSHLRGSGMGFVYGVGNLGKFIGPAGLAFIAGSSNYVKPAATLDILIPGFNYFAFWFLLGAAAFWLVGMETRGRSIAEIDAEMMAPRAAVPKEAPVV